MPFANSAKWSRDRAIKEVELEPVLDNDTIWIVERINEVDKSGLGDLADF